LNFTIYSFLPFGAIGKPVVSTVAFVYYFDIQIFAVFETANGGFSLSDRNICAKNLMF
jgi:hypothetical protein